MMDSVDLPALFQLRELVDEAIEVALVERRSLNELMASLLPRVAKRLGASLLVFETYGEDLSQDLQSFQHPQGTPLPERDEVVRRTGDGHRESFTLSVAEGHVVAQPIDVAGAWFGRAAMVVPEGVDLAQSRESLNAFTEVLDNHLFAIRAAREKHAVMMRVGHALRHRVLGEGLGAAIAILADAVPIRHVVLVYCAEENAGMDTLQVKLFDGAQAVADPRARLGADEEELKALGHDFFTGRSRALLERFGATGAQEEVLINGITNSVVVGKVVATSKTGTFNTYDRELIASFAGFIRQRVVDFNKEWRSLAASFRPADIVRLLQSDSYRQRFLAPREAEVAMLYVDISGFTRISEQVLRTPARVAELVEKWSTRAVSLVWSHGGVFDKMVGDCIIALFGPPFYETSPSSRLASAIRCAHDIRAMTQALPEDPDMEALRESGIDVSTGVNLAPLFVGQFAPNDNFTGFSSGMNNTARLQGCAKKSEILVMEGAVAELPPDSGFAFGPPQSAAVKNVGEPLRFRRLEGITSPT